MAKTGNTGVSRILNAFVYSYQGLRDAYRYEEAFRQEIWLTVVLVPVALYLGDSPVHKALLVASWLLVLIVELFNSALEAVVDRISNEHHELAGRAKDIGSAAVLLAFVLAIIIWAAILL